ncbi:MAG TPA: EamA family transporter [Verrucomicrobiae bacterium]|nr:EamA family transporter [Verrucomicrobiae bacterium]
MDWKPTSPAVSRGRVAAALAAVYFIWGSTYLAVAIALESFPPLILSTLWSLIPGLIFVAAMRLRGVPWPTRREFWSSSIVGVLLVGGVSAFVWAEQHVASGITALMLGTIPLWMALVEWAWGGHRPTGKVWIGLLMGFAGVVVLGAPQLHLGDAAVPPGRVGLLLASAISWAIGSAYARRAKLPASMPMSIGLQFITGGMLLAIGAVIAGESMPHVTTRSLAALVYLALVDSLIGYTAYLWLLQKKSSALASTYAFVNPVVALTLGWWLADEPVTIRALLAAAVIVGSVALITLGPRDSVA